MKIVVNLLAMAIVALVLAGVGYLGFVAAGEVGRYLGELDALVRVSLFAAGTVALLATVMVVGGLRAAARIVAAANSSRERAELYRLLMSHWRSVVRGGPAVLDAATLDGLEAELVLLGSNAVIAAYKRLRDEAREGDNALTALVQAMRSDLGRARGFDDGAVRDLLSGRGRDAGSMELRQLA